jgi:hypothetical protein
MFVFDETDGNGWHCRWWRVIVDDWLIGETVELGVVYSLSDGIYDGRTSYPSGDYEQLIFVTAN